MFSLFCVNFALIVLSVFRPTFKKCLNFYNNTYIPSFKSLLLIMEFFLRSLQFVVKLFYLILYPILQNWLPRKDEHFIPPITNKLLMLSATQLIRRLKWRKITSKELVRAYINRIKEVNPYINAIVENRFKQALQEAEEADLCISSCERNSINEMFEKYPLLGLPYTVKESCGVKDMSHVVGSLRRVGEKGIRSNSVLENLKAAGAILLLVSANPEHCSSIETNTFTNGRCLNPYDSRRTCGGSSGGEGALNGSGASLFGIGSDIAGSIRIPALFNGVFGHKPTGCFFNNRGHFPNCDDTNCWDYLQMGPITRFGKDLYLLMRVMAGRSGNRITLLKNVDLEQIKIYYSFGFEGLNGFLHQSVSADIKHSILKAVKYFKNRGLTTKRAKIKLFHSSTEIALSAFARLRGFPYLIRTDNRPPSITQNLIELIKSVLGYSNFTKEALLLELMRATNVYMGAKNMAKYIEETKRLKKEVLGLLGKKAVLIFPTFHVPAIHHNTSFFPLWGVDYCLIFNVLGLPCTHIPMGLNSEGLPIGFQVVAGPWQDTLCLEIAAELEKAFGGWVAPTRLAY